MLSAWYTITFLGRVDRLACLKAISSAQKDTLDRPLGVFRIGNRRLKKFEASWPSVRISLQTDVASLLCVDPLPSFS